MQNKNSYVAEGEFSFTEVCIQMFLFFTVVPMLLLYSNVLRPVGTGMKIAIITLFLLLMIFVNYLWDYLTDKQRRANKKQDRRLRRIHRNTLRNQSKITNGIPPEDDTCKGRMTPDGRDFKKVSQ